MSLTNAAAAIFFLTFHSIDCSNLLYKIIDYDNVMNNRNFIVSSQNGML